MYNIPFQSIDWSKIKKTEYKGVTGKSYWQTILLDGLRIRIVEYSANYLADHWCQKGHIVYCLEGSFINENENGDQVTLTPGMSYIVSDDLSSHRSRTLTGVRLLIIDGDFLTSHQ
ncbi:DHCW motif cupin fold protein [Mucilaginibacter sp. X4EP1]|uniref:DHCW motif cupin fold protein n=1 Tax=Mucilaginibacter sp. X4EP1 TaxID=2723092 RepID=UPI00216877D6|nr:DHCW motif cupin fold protein [Mucilaginibacter sp. X4EP1]MCS3811941.1 mannose-6-phosphate isomerase class I [Mucilaginibacter sp. X4EP1]